MVGSQSKITAALPLADDHRVAGLGAGLDQRLLDAEPGQPVGEVADGLVVGEVGLPHPAVRLGAADDVPVASSATTVKPESSTAVGRSTMRAASRSGAAARAWRDQLGHREGQLPQAARGWPR